MKAVDVVLNYFEEAPVEAADAILHIVTKVVARRRLGSQPGTAVVTKKRKLSAEARERIAEGQRKRHAAAREQPEQPKKGKRTNSAPAEFEHSPETQQALG